MKTTVRQKAKEMHNKGTTWLQFMKNCDKYDWTAIGEIESVPVIEGIKAFIDDYEYNNVPEEIL